jgi:hypothetical protein
MSNVLQSARASRARQRGAGIAVGPAGNGRGRGRDGQRTASGHRPVSPSRRTSRLRSSHLRRVPGIRSSSPRGRWSKRRDRSPEAPRPVFESPGPVIDKPRIASALLDEHLVSPPRPGRPWRMRWALRDWRSRTPRRFWARARHPYDYVVLDTPPFVPFPDCRLIAKSVDGFALVVASNRTQRRPG